LRKKILSTYNPPIVITEILWVGLH
jgi:hypothetical protein